MQDRAADLYYQHHPDHAFESNLPSNFVTFYPHVSTKVELLDHNNKFTYYLAKEVRVSEANRDEGNRDERSEL